MLIYSKYKYLKNYFLKFFNKDKVRSGFTLVELLVVMSIFTIITTALVIQQSKWNDRLQLNTKLYDLALYIRQAQLYSLGVKEYQTGSPIDKFNIGYGIYINMTNPSQFIFFADTNKNFEYNVGEAVETKTLTNGVTIHRICGIGIFTGLTWCSNSFLGQLLIHKTSLSFKRPETSAIMEFINSGNDSTTDLLRQNVTIYLRSLGGLESSIVVESNGQVSI